MDNTSILFYDLDTLNDPEIVININLADSICHNYSYGDGKPRSFVYNNNDLFTVFKAAVGHTGTILNRYLLIVSENGIAIGHCFIIYEANRNICGIWNICLHGDNIEKKGQGTKLMKRILLDLNIRFSSDTTLWLTIDTKNKYFLRAINLYIKVGFANPFIAFTDPWNKMNFSFGMVALTRNNKLIEHIPQNQHENVITEAIYVLQQYLKCTIRQNESFCVKPGCVIPVCDNKNFCNINVKFTDLALTILSGLTTTYTGTDNKSTQKETCGIFVLETPRQEFGHIVWYATPTEFTLGTEFTCDLDYYGKNNFHTHTYNSYKSNVYRASISPPSGLDYRGFFKSALLKLIYKEKLSHGEAPLGFTCVITVEGIYVISIGNYFLTDTIYDYFISLDTPQKEKYMEEIAMQFELWNFAIFNKLKIWGNIGKGTSVDENIQYAKRYAFEISLYKLIIPIESKNILSEYEFKIKFVNKTTVSIIGWKNSDIYVTTFNYLSTDHISGLYNPKAQKTYFIRIILNDKPELVNLFSTTEIIVRVPKSYSFGQWLCFLLVPEPIFNCQFFSWNEMTKWNKYSPPFDNNKYFSINYHSLKDSCFVTTKTMEIYNKLYS